MPKDLVWFFVFFIAPISAGLFKRYWSHLNPRNHLKTLELKEDIRSHCGMNKYMKNPFTKRIVGGIPSKQYEWPWLVSLQLYPVGEAIITEKRAFDIVYARQAAEKIINNSDLAGLSKNREQIIEQIINLMKSEDATNVTNENGLTRPIIYGHLCGGSLISPSWVLTAKHCFDPRVFDYLSAEPERWTVRVGEHNLHESDIYQVDHEVEKIIIYENNKRGKTDYVIDDIALLKLKKAVQLSEHIQPACLPYPSETFEAGMHCSAAGWGITQENGEVSPVPRHITVPLWAHESCNETFETLMLLEPMFHILPTVICAGNTMTEDACQYDSGGPLMCKSNVDGQYIIVGIISYGFKCASGFPGIYTRLTSYLEWIKNVTTNE